MAHTKKHRFVIDTSVLIHDLRVLTGALMIDTPPELAHVELLIPLYAIEELDLMKEEQSERGQRAREAARQLDLLRREGPLDCGQASERGSIIKVISAEDESLPQRMIAQPSLIYDYLILRCAIEHRASLITLDTNLRVRAEGSSVRVVDWLESQSDIHATPHRTTLPTTHREGHYDSVWGVSARNQEQAQALNALLDPEVTLVTLTGKAGTGKTLVALAAGLAQITENERYQRVMVSRAIFPLGRDIGYLPGSLEDKMEPWLQPIYDNLDYLLGQRERRQPHRSKPRAEDLVDMGMIEVVPITYIRGRSIPDQYLMIDEAQNLTPHEMKTMLTRAGQGTKVILLGDPDQVDHPYLDAERNGLTYVVSRFSGQSCSAHIHLTQGERSPLAELAADLL
jgi:PhoH-like ATPase